MMRSGILPILLTAWTVVSAFAFVVQPPATPLKLTKMHLVPHLPAATLEAPSVTVTGIVQQSMQQQQQQDTTTIRLMDQGINNYMASSSSSSQLLSLKERHIPTPEEVAAKKANFNLWFWGGGFVAPFLATIFYFGFRFWEK
jgi:hypothetical protein